MKIVPLGAGQDVGRSCILVTLNNKTIMFDCGMHMGYNDERRFPDFSYISKTGDFTQRIDAIIISHFHLDHCGALPHFTEICGYDGPIYMTAPTKAIVPILLEDYRKIMVDKKGETNFFTSENIKDCMNKVIVIGLHETIYLEENFEICAYYAGHVLGAAMIYAKCGNESVLYTGDYNMTPDRHLGSAWVERLKPSVLITESTYGTTIRDSKRARERDFLEKVHNCIKKGGKVLIPCFALGRAQELCILIESYWERMGLTVPVYFSAGLTERANRFYKLFINWTNQKVKSSFTTRNPFDFKYIKPWKHEYADLPTPMVTFATPGMLHIGMSLEIFKKWAPDPKNMLIIPGYCVAGTVGSKVLDGHKVVEIDQFTKINVNLQVENLSFSAHADAKGIMELICQAEPKNVVLVHGEKSRMSFLKSKIMSEFGLPCYDPANGESLSILDNNPMEIGMLSNKLFKNSWKLQMGTNNRNKDNQIDISSNIKSKNKTSPESSNKGNSNDDILWDLVSPIKKVPINGILVKNRNENCVKLVSIDDLRSLLNDSDLIRFNSNLEDIGMFESHYLFTTMKSYSISKLPAISDLRFIYDSVEIVALSCLHELLKIQYGIVGELVVYSQHVEHLKISSKPNNCSNLSSDHSIKAEPDNSISISEFNASESELSQPFKRQKLETEISSLHLIRDTLSVEDTVDEVIVSPSEIKSNKSETDVQADIQTSQNDTANPPLTDYSEFGVKYSSSKNKPVIANLNWNNINVAIPVNSNSQIENVKLFKIMWELNDEKAVSIVLSSINKLYS
ncbi:Integrator complex subunit 11-like protein [Smittium culicis]|uniref:Integrator complex subunit 11-like protein n=1 Tax=Smittium culicis TaxID=133412 RepID=A0A1R1Y7P6_9FUNG|nr:Integrator complex subunit 11-like protein [Smittium culicis]